MILIPPFVVTDAMVAASNIIEDDHPEWEAGTYTLGDRVIVSGTTHRIFESLTDNNTDDPLGEGVTTWLDLGATNRWKAFDGLISDPVTNAGAITYSLTPAEMTNAVALFGLDAGFVQVQVFQVGEETAVYDQTITLVDNTGVTDWYGYFFAPISKRDDAVFTGLPAFAGDAVEITVDNGSGEARLGQAVLGFSHELGETLDGTTVGMRDFSTKEQDDFGNFTIVERPYSDTVDFSIAIDPQRVRFVRRLLAELRATPAVYFAGDGTDQYGTTVYGYFSEFDIPVKSAGKSIATIEVEELV